MVYSKPLYADPSGQLPLITILSWSSCLQHREILQWDSSRHTELFRQTRYWSARKLEADSSKTSKMACGADREMDTTLNPGAAHLADNEARWSWILPGAGTYGSWLFQLVPEWLWEKGRKGVWLLRFSRKRCEAHTLCDKWSVARVWLNHATDEDKGSL